MRDSYTNRTICGRMRGMVVGEGGRSSGVLLYSKQKSVAISSIAKLNGFARMFHQLSSLTKT